MEVVDEAGKINVNAADKGTLMRLPGMTEDVADAIQDWTDEDDEPRAGGAEEGYYRQLEYGYRVRNGHMRTVRELLMVRGVDEGLMYGPDWEGAGQAQVVASYDENEGWVNYLTVYSKDPDLDAEGERRVNINSADEGALARNLGIEREQAQWIVENRPDDGYDNIADLISESSAPRAGEGRGGGLDLETFKEIADKITVHDKDSVPPRVNVNTAGIAVLRALFGDDEGGANLAEAIVSYRAALAAGMDSVGDLLDVPGLSISDFKRVADVVTVRSDVYNVRCEAYGVRGQDPGARVCSEAVIDRNGEPFDMLYWYCGARN